MTKYKRHRFYTYLAIGLTLLCMWGAGNYYSINQEVASVQENVGMIEEEVVEIEVKQEVLRMEQRVIVEEIPTKMMERRTAPASGSPATPPPAETLMRDAERFAELQDKIAEMEKEKAELQAELEDETVTLGESFKAMAQITKMDVTNPLINILLLPLIGWTFKRIIDFVFNRIEDRYHDT